MDRPESSQDTLVATLPGVIELAMGVRSATGVETQCGIPVQPSKLEVKLMCSPVWLYILKILLFESRWLIEEEDRKRDDALLVLVSQLNSSLELKKWFP